MARNGLERIVDYRNRAEELRIVAEMYPKACPDRKAAYEAVQSALAKAEVKS